MAKLVQLILNKIRIAVKQAEIYAVQHDTCIFENTKALVPCFVSVWAQYLQLSILKTTRERPLLSNAFVYVGDKKEVAEVQACSSYNVRTCWPRAETPTGVHAS